MVKFSGLHKNAVGSISIVSYNRYVLYMFWLKQSILDTFGKKGKRFM